jgi:hypothetical protein
MLEASSTIRIRSAATIVMTTIMLTCALSACESTSNWLKGRKTAEPEPIILGAPETNSYLIGMYDLVNGDPATQAEIYADAKSRAQLTPDPTTKLRYALVLAAPGHSGTNELEAQSLFRELLSQKELLNSAEIALATIHLKEVEQRIVLGEEASRLRSENIRTSNTEDEAVAQRIATVEAENRRLKRSLAEAESKLEAITSIERSIRDQPDNN